MRSSEFLSGLQVPWLFSDLSPQALETVVHHKNQWIRSYVKDTLRSVSRRYTATGDRLEYFEQCLTGLVSNYMLHVMRQDMVAYLIDLDEPARHMSEHGNDRKSIIYLDSPIAATLSAMQGNPESPLTAYQQTSTKLEADKIVGLIVMRTSSNEASGFDELCRNTFHRWSSDIEICIIGQPSLVDRSYLREKMKTTHSITNQFFPSTSRVTHFEMYS